MRKLDLARIAAKRFGGGARLEIQAKSGESFICELPPAKAAALVDELHAALVEPAAAAASAPPSPDASTKRTPKPRSKAGAPAEQE